jgi:hypothetical protein
MPRKLPKRSPRGRDINAKKAPEEATPGDA